MEFKRLTATSISSDEVHYLATLDSEGNVIAAYDLKNDTSTSEGIMLNIYKKDEGSDTTHMATIGSSTSHMLMAFCGSSMVNILNKGLERMQEEERDIDINVAHSLAVDVVFRVLAEYANQIEGTLPEWGYDTHGDLVDEIMERVRTKRMEHFKAATTEPVEPEELREADEIEIG